MNKQARTWAALTLAGAMFAAAGAAAAADAPRPKRLIVTFKAGTSQDQRASDARALGLTLRDDLGDIGVAVLEKDSPFSPQDVVRADALPGVAHVEEDVYRNWLLDAPASFSALPAPDAAAALKALAPGLAGARKTAAQDAARASRAAPWGVARVDAPAAWSSGQGAGIKVAVIDTGIDCTHPDLQCDFSAGTNIVEPGADPMDDNEHGTHVSGTIAGRGADGGVYGVAPQAVLIPVKVLNAQGEGSLSDIIAGIDWAVKAGVDVINMSLGGPAQSPALKRAVEGALAHGVVVVCAAGNSGPEADTVGYPAGYPGVIAVAASDRNDNVADFSSRGPQLAFVAPGVDITSTVPGGGYAKLSGTSMASPHVAGLAALALERGARGPAGVRAAFKAAASSLCGADGCASADAQGRGMIDAAKLR
ncbi:MAG: S8 family peptidase [Elusimicrobia bacterium]|nr:S8 family peptidase [Elusimicrobiota bacterium]